MATLRCISGIDSGRLAAFTGEINNTHSSGRINRVSESIEEPIVSLVKAEGHYNGIIDPLFPMRIKNFV
jgi:hypothetical protein